VEGEQINRPGLLLANGHIYAAWGSNGCNGVDQGWVMSYNASTLAQEGTFNTEPNRFLASIWQQGAGLSADNAGNIYFESGEGPLVVGTTYPDAMVKLSQVGNLLSVADWFIPYNWKFINNHDLDMNNAVLLLPDQPGAHPHEAVGVGKQGTIYLLDRDNMGHLCTTCTTTDTQIVQELTLGIGHETGSAVYWNNRVYFTPQGKPIAAFALTNGLLSITPVLQSVPVGGGCSPTISSNGTSNGILWCAYPGGATTGVLTAFNASTLQQIYGSKKKGTRDQIPPLPHFGMHIEINGKVYIGTRSSLAVFGLLP
jgi:hypothetical protein